MGLVRVGASQVETGAGLRYCPEGQAPLRRAAMKSVLSTCSASIAELRHDPVALLSAAGGAPVAILNHDELAAYLVPAATYEWLMERLDDAELEEIVRERQSQLGDAVEVDLDEL
jgi:antitoxin StbD